MTYGRAARRFASLPLSHTPHRCGYGIRRTWWGTRRTVSLKLVNPPEANLAETATAFRKACEFIGECLAAEPIPLNFFSVRQATYRRIKNLPSEMRNNAAKAVTEAWNSWIARDRKGRRPSFEKPYVRYTFGRDWSILAKNLLSIRTLRRRERLAYVTGSRDAQRLSESLITGGVGGALLKRRESGWFLNVCVDLPNPESWEPRTPIGVDRGIDCIAVARAVDESPLVCSAGSLRSSRTRYLQTRNRLQEKNTASSKRVLRHLSGREARMVLDANRKAAKAVAGYALRFDQPVLVLENLCGVQARCISRTRPRGTARTALSGWTYSSFLNCLNLVAESRGIPVEFVTPAWSSRTCPRCGDARAENRKGSAFHCRYCAYQNHADVVGATNLARRWLHEHALQPWGLVNGPNERGSQEGGPNNPAAPTDAQAPGVPESVDTPLPTIL